MMFKPEDRGNATRTAEERSRWFEAGGKFVGGTLKGLASKMGYLKRLGVTAIWVSPIFKQVAYQESYHGYGIQNFLEVHPHFGQWVMEIADADFSSLSDNQIEDIWLAVNYKVTFPYRSGATG